MKIEIKGTDRDKEKVINFMKKERIAFIHLLPEGLNDDNSLILSPSGKGKSKIIEAIKSGKAFIDPFPPHYCKVCQFNGYVQSEDGGETVDCPQCDGSGIFNKFEN